MFLLLRTVPQRLLIALVRGYRIALSPWLGNSCRFEPTCSAYALEALTRHGAGTGSYLAVCRIGRCQPWCAGGIDPVPTAAPPLFAFLRRHRVTDARLSSSSTKNPAP